MLVLTRKVNESVLITNELTGESIQIMVTTADQAIRLGFVAAQHYKIERLDAGQTKEYIRRNRTVQHP